MEDKEPLSAIDRLRSTEMLPKQYRSGVYDNSRNTVKQFVFILNDQTDESRFNTLRAKVSQQFAENTVHEIKMSALPNVTSASQRDIWQDYMDLDLRTFDRTASRVKICGTAFTTNDRTQAQVVIRKIIEKTLLPFAIQRIQGIEANIAKTRKGLNKFLRMFKSSDRGENDGA